MIDDWEARAIAERLWDRNPLHWLGVAANASAEGMTLLEYVRRRIDQLKGRNT